MTTRIVRFAGLMLCLIVFGCASSPPSRFYMFHSIPEMESRATSEAKVAPLIIGVGPIEVPAYLDRPQIVRRSGSNELDLAEFHQWAEPLKDTFLRVIVENLTYLLDMKNIAVVFWKNSKMEPDYQIVVDVIRMDGAVGENATLVAQWFISDDERREKVAPRMFNGAERVKGSDIRDFVEAQNLLLRDLSNRLADDVRRVTSNLE